MFEDENLISAATASLGGDMLCSAEKILALEYFATCSMSPKNLLFSFRRDYMLNKTRK